MRMEMEDLVTAAQKVLLVNNFYHKISKICIEV